MIRVRKRNPIPPILLAQGLAAEQANQLLYDQNQAGYNSGAAKFTIDPDIYNHPSVKARLKVIQHNKCCFCEKDQTDEYAQVEHYRPKQGYNRHLGDGLQRPGYYWLAYRWSNLYFVCNICNNVKSTAFYLVNETDRARNHHHPIDSEAPLILDPGGLQDPRLHISFVKEVAKGLTPSGNTTIDVCRLNRSNLQILRGKLLKDLKLMIEYVKKADDLNSPTVRRTQRKLREAMSSKGIFSAMATDYIMKSRVPLN